jgi:predicted membrane protein
MKTLIQVVGFAILFNFILPISFLLIFGFDYNKRFLEAYHGTPSLTSKILGVCIMLTYIIVLITSYILKYRDTENSVNRIFRTSIIISINLLVAFILSFISWSGIYITINEYLRN